MMCAEVSMWRANAERMALDPYTQMGDGEWRFRAAARLSAADVLGVLAEAVTGTAVVPWPHPQQALTALRRLGSAPWRIDRVDRQGARHHIRLSVGGATLALVVEMLVAPYLKEIEGRP